MKRLNLAMLLSLLILPSAIPTSARQPATAAQRDDDHGRGRPDLVIDRAIYGAGNKQHDITAPLNAEIRDGRLRIQVRNDTMGGDPARNQPKTLQVWFTFRGRQFMEALNENDYLDLPGPRALGPQWDPGHHDLAINRAVYGVGNKQHDITAPLAAEIRGGRLRIQVRNDTMGGDPARNQPKTLQVWFTFNGHQDMVTLRENDYLELPGPWAFDDHDRDHR
jgi:hypothetical protein